MTDLLQAMQPLFAQAFVLWGAPVSWVEVVAFVLAIAMVVCNIRVNPIGWPLAIVSSLLYVALFWDNKLYGDASLQVFFALVASWGWWQWLRGTQDGGHALQVRSMGLRGRLAVVVATLALWPALGWFLKHYTDTDVPWWDAFPTAASVVGQWLLGRKYVENWPMWVVVNAVSIALFAYKGLWVTAVLYATFLGMSFAGWRAWQQVERTA